MEEKKEGVEERGWLVHGRSDTYSSPMSKQPHTLPQAILLKNIRFYPAAKSVVLIHVLI